MRRPASARQKGRHGPPHESGTVPHAITSARAETMREVPRPPCWVWDRGVPHPPPPALSNTAAMAARRREAFPVSVPQRGWRARQHVPRVDVRHRICPNAGKACASKVLSHCALCFAFRHPAALLSTSARRSLEGAFARLRARCLGLRPRAHRSVPPLAKRPAPRMPQPRVREADRGNPPSPRSRCLPCRSKRKTQLRAPVGFYQQMQPPPSP
jgi:hypothetical protein